MVSGEMNSIMQPDMENTNLCRKGNYHLKLLKSSGIVVIGGDSCSEGHGFKSLHYILDGHFSHLFVVKIVARMFV